MEDIDRSSNETGTLKFGFIAVRHAESEWNAFARKCKSQKKKANNVANQMGFKPLKPFKDPPITPKGVRQAKKLAVDLSKVIGRIKVILVSPLYRALQTLKIALDELVKKKVITFEEFNQNTKIICSPLVMPRLTTTPDFPFRFQKAKNIFLSEDNKNQFNIDFSQVDALVEEHGDLWFLSTIKRYIRPDKKGIPVRLEKLEQVYSHKSSFIDFCKELYKQRPKTPDTTTTVADRLSEFSKMIKKDLKELNEYNLMIVSHGGFIQKYFKIKAASNAKVYKFEKKL